MIVATKQPHAGAINDLAARGLVKRIAFELDGVRHEANSIWAATEWLKHQGLEQSGRHRWLPE